MARFAVIFLSYVLVVTETSTRAVAGVFDISDIQVRCSVNGDTADVDITVAVKVADLGVQRSQLRRVTVNRSKEPITTSLRDGRVTHNAVVSWKADTISCKVTSMAFSTPSKSLTTTRKVVVGNLSIIPLIDFVLSGDEANVTPVARVRIGEPASDKDAIDCSFGEIKVKHDGKEVIVRKSFKIDPERHLHISQRTILSDPTLVLQLAIEWKKDKVFCHVEGRIGEERGNGDLSLDVGVERGK